MRAVICLAVLLGVPMASDPGGDPFRVFGPASRLPRRTVPGSNVASR